MRLGVLFSGGKDSTLSLHKAAENQEIVCLITLISKNKESYMFHTPNIDLTGLQAEALGLPLIRKVTEGLPEEELEELQEAIAQAIEVFGIEGIVTGAVESFYQYKRIKRICNNLEISCFNPLWKTNQKALLEELVAKEFNVIITGVFAYPLDLNWLGKAITRELIEQLTLLGEKYGLSISGEGGEIETTVIDAPLFTKRIEIIDSVVEGKGNSGILVIKRAALVEK